MIFERYMFRDRTTEFRNIVANAQSKFYNKVNGLHSTSIQSRSHFLSDAMKINEGICACYIKLERLGKLCKSRSLFEDPADEINALVYTVKEDVVHLKQKVEELSPVMAVENRRGSEHGKTHRRSIMTSLEKKLARFSKDFKNILELRTENLRIQRNRRENFSKSVVVPTLVNSRDIVHDDKLKYRSFSSHAIGPDTVIDLGSNNRGNTKSNSEDKLKQDQLLIVQESVPTYMDERMQAVQTIESTIIELGGIFQQLAQLVGEQEEHIQRIDHNVALTNLHIESAHSELKKYLSTLTSNRWLMIKLFGIFFVFIIIFILLS